jgi:copper transport protein
MHSPHGPHTPTRARPYDTSTTRKPRTRRRRVCAIAIALAALLWWLFPGIASAHAHLTQADPSPDSVLARAPSVASFVFDEPLNPALTRVAVLDAAGRAVTARHGYLAAGHDGELWQLPLPRLAPGTYSVLWTSESATDGHVMSSFYTFRVATAGASDRLAAVSGSAAGAMGGASAGGDTLFAIGNGAAVVALFAWLGQVAQALWLGALVIELAVLGPARRGGESPEARLARLATPRSWRLGIAALIGAAVSAFAEMVSLAVQGTGGDWGTALSPATLAGMLSSQNGEITIARFAVIGAALFIALRVRVPSATAAPISSIGPAPADEWASETAAIVAPWMVRARYAAPSWATARLSLVVLAGIYMLLVALSGHAANISPLWLSAGVDWLHLICTAAWVGGIAVLAFAVMPARRGLRPELRAPAILPLLDRFSPVAYVAVATLALSGLYNATSHLHQPAMVAQTIYGHLLLLKSALVGVLMAMSASHVRWLRPLIARAQQSLGLRSFNADPARALATVHEGLASLAGRLRVEAVVGALVLLATALMGQTLPASNAQAAPASNVTSAASGTTMVMPPGPSGAASAMPAGHGGATLAMPAGRGSISGVMTRGDLRARLSVTPPQVGAMRLSVTVWERGRRLTSDDGAVVIHLYPAAQPELRATLDGTPDGTRFGAAGSLALDGTWHADVLVRTALVDRYRTLPFVFRVGAHARFLTVLGRQAPSHSSSRQARTRGGGMGSP